MGLPRLSDVVKRFVALTPYRVARNAANRFDLVHDYVGQLALRGFRPKRVIDCGAHLGTFALAAHAAFPGARIDMVEPQPACRATLEGLAAARGFAFHPCAVSDKTGRLGLVSGSAPETGAHLVWPDQAPPAGGTVEDVPVTTLDALLALDTADAPALLKLDLQGHEIHALRGAAATLRQVEVVVTEVSFYRLAGEASFAELIAFFDTNGFDVFDVASLSGRGRDGRLRQGDVIFARRDSPLAADTAWA